MTAPAERDASPWTPQACAEDLLARCEDAIQSGADDAALLEALGDEGLRPGTAASLVAALRHDLAGLKGPPVAGDSAPLDAALSRPAAAGAAVSAGDLDLWRLRTCLRAPLAPWRIDRDQSATLRLAFVEGGLPPEVASELVLDIAAVERAMHVGFAHRRRRLGLQGMAVGVGGALVMAWAGSSPGAARWHLLTAAAAAGLAAFSLVLWRQARGRIEEPL